MKWFVPMGDPFLTQAVGIFQWPQRNCVHKPPRIGAVTELSFVTGPISFLETCASAFQTGPGCPWGLFPEQIGDIHPDLRCSCCGQSPAMWSPGPGWRRGKACRIAPGSQGPAGQPQQRAISSNRTKQHTNQGGACEPDGQLCPRWRCGMELGSRGASGRKRGGPSVRSSPSPP